MKLKLCACLIAGAVMCATQAVATPMHPGTVFLSVDVNGANAGGGQSLGPTQAGFQGWTAYQGFDQLDPNYMASEDWGNNGGPPTGLSKTFGSIAANMIGVGGRGARNRGSDPDTGGNAALLQDFPFTSRVGQDAFGRNFVKLQLAGLTPNTTYEFTGYAREPFNGTDLSNDTGNPANTPPVPGDQSSYQAWSDLAKLGGVDGPAAWMDANVSAGASYQPSVGGVNNPIPNYGRSPISGPGYADQYHFSQSFLTNSDASGKVTVYTWNDSNGFSGTQTATLLNGFQLAAIPEPASLVLLGIGLIGAIALGRRVR